MLSIGNETAVTVAIESAVVFVLRRQGRAVVAVPSTSHILLIAPEVEKRGSREKGTQLI